MLTIDEAALRLRVSRRTIRRLIDAGKLAAVDLTPPGSSRSLWRIPLESFESLVDLTVPRAPRADHSYQPRH